MEHRFVELPLVLSQRLYFILQHRGWLPPREELPDNLALRNLRELANENQNAADRVLDTLQRTGPLRKNTSAVIMQEVKMQKQGLGQGLGWSSPADQRVSGSNAGKWVNGTQSGFSPGMPPVAQSISPSNYTSHQHLVTNPPNLQRTHLAPSSPTEACNLPAPARHGSFQRDPVTPERCITGPSTLSPPSPQRTRSSIRASTAGFGHSSAGRANENPVVRRLDLEREPSRTKTPRIEPGARSSMNADTRLGAADVSTARADVSIAGNASLDGWMERGVVNSQRSFVFPTSSQTPPTRFETPPPEENSVLINRNALLQSQGFCEPENEGSAHRFSGRLEQGLASQTQLERTPSMLSVEDKHVLSDTQFRPIPSLPPNSSRSLTPSYSHAAFSPGLNASVSQPIRGSQPTRETAPPAPFHIQHQEFVHTAWQQPQPYRGGSSYPPRNPLQERLSIGANGALQGLLWGENVAILRDTPNDRQSMPPSLQRERLHGGRVLNSASVGDGSGKQSDPLAKAFGELEFKKRWLVEYHGGHKLTALSQVMDNVMLTSALVSFRALTISDIENRLITSLPREHRRKRIATVLEREDADAHVVYGVKVRSNRAVELMAPATEKAGTAGGRLFGSDRLLTVYIDDLTKNPGVCKATLRDSLFICARTYSFLLPKDATHKDVRILFLALASDAAADARAGFQPYGSVDDARARVAHFHTCANVPKFLARLQLPFSKTWRAFDLKALGGTLVVVKDVPCRNSSGVPLPGELIHTDGNGFISKDLAERIPAGISQGCLPKESTSNDIPLVTQFRLFHEGAAFKGTVTLNQLLPPKTIVLPESCRKVTRDQHWAAALPEALSSFEVCQSSQEPSGDARLNQQLILLLWYGGVSTGTFLRLANEALNDLLTASLDLRTAFNLVISSGRGDEGPRHQTEIAYRMLTSGFDMDELHLRKTVRSLQKERFLELSRGRIPVRNTYSNLMGVADPTGQLAPDEIMVILPGGARYLTSDKVLVFRQPGLHPGDVRVFRARKVPGIEALVGTSGYAIIFSVQGPRSASDMMAGGDLDGDFFWVCFNEELCAQFQPSDPMPRIQPSGLKPEPLSENADDLNCKLREHFLTCAYAIQGAIGTAQRNWLAWADHESQTERPVRGSGPGSDECLKLNEIYCRALDAGKSGEKVSVPSELVAWTYPTYMGKGKEVRERHGNLTDFTEYPSKSVLGQIAALWDPEEEEKKAEPVIFDEELKLEWAGEAFPVLNQWNALLSRYKKEVQELMTGHRVGEFRDAALERLKLKYKALLWEQHLPSGAAVVAAAACTDKDPAAANAVAAAIAKLEETETPPPDVILAARAAYSVTYADANTVYDRELERGQALTFPWNVAGRVLCAIKLAAVKRTDPNFVETLSSYGVLKALWTRHRRNRGPVEVDFGEEAMDLN